MDWEREPGGKPKNATAFCTWYVKNIGTTQKFNSIRPTVYMAIQYKQEVLAFIREKFMSIKVSSNKIYIVSLAVCMFFFFFVLLWVFVASTIPRPTMTRFLKF